MLSTVELEDLVEGLFVDVVRWSEDVDVVEVVVVRSGFTVAVQGATAPLPM